MREMKEQKQDNFNRITNRQFRLQYVLHAGGVDKEMHMYT